MRCSSVVCRLVVVFCVSLTLASTLSAEETVLLWPNGAPGKVGDEDVDKPWLWQYPAPKENASGTAVIVCPGGGYGGHAVDHEGTQVARWFNSIGVSAYVLKYRLGQRYKHPAPMQDVQRAIQHVRAHAEQYGVTPHRIGVMGFSAGGHLASTAATHFRDANPQADDPVERVSSRPDFAVLAYPVISMTESWGHGGSKRNLLGENPDPELARSLSNDLMVTPQTPPTFLFHTTEDTGVPVENSLAFFAACRKHKIPVEMHIYQFGPHGVGLAPGDPALSTWKERLHDWLRNSGFLADAKRAAVSGKILIQGEPLKWGQVAFHPANAFAPVAMAMVRNGNFKLDAARGPTIGDNRVTVVHMGDVAPGPTLKDAVASTTSLMVNIADAANQFELDVK
ncbi:MAG: alpha/beta hydrolase [Planctomycetaceae bacterium]|nr:alpha/beta hydrolase [Planctomycetaceae bacterium]